MEQGEEQFLTERVAPLLQARGIVLFEAKAFYYAGRRMLRFLVDRPYGGITLEECAGLNRTISAMLEEDDVIKESSVVEVSSPGVERPLISEADFRRVSGQKIRVFLKEQMEGKREVAGVVVGVDSGSLRLSGAGGESCIPLRLVLKGKQVL